MPADLPVGKTPPAAWRAGETEAKVLLPIVQFSIKQTAYCDQIIIKEQKYFKKPYST